MRTKWFAGDKVGYLTLVSRTEASNGSSRTMPAWVCKCDCGRETIVRINALYSGAITSCGCVNAQQDLTGQKLSEHASVLLDLGDSLLCRCDCGHTARLARTSALQHRSTGRWQTTSLGRHVCPYTPQRHDDLQQGQEIHGLALVRPVPHPHKTEWSPRTSSCGAWECVCTRCGSVQVKLSPHLRSGSVCCVYRCVHRPRKPYRRRERKAA